jgi:hypothetical protein
VERELRETTQAMRAIAVDSDAFTQARSKVESLNQEIKSLKQGKDAVTRSGANFGQAMLQSSRGIQDLAAAGIPGIVNNLEGMATALGLTAGAAGGITLVAVAVDLLVRNWDKIKTAFGEPDKVKAFWSAITPDEAQATRMKDMATAQERIADAIERATAARIKGIESQQQEVKNLEEMAKNWEWVKPADQLPSLDPAKPSEKAVAAATEQAKAEENFAGKDAQFQVADANYKKQKKLIDDMNALASAQDRLKLANEADLKEITSITANIHDPVAAGLAAPKIQEIRDRMAKRAQEQRQSMEQVPGLTDGLTGDPEKDRVSLEDFAKKQRDELARLEGARYSAAQESDAARGEMTTAQQATRDRVRIDQDKAASDALQATGLPPAPGQFAGADAALGVTEAMQRIEQARLQNTQAVQTLTNVTESVARDAGETQQRLALAMNIVAMAFRKMSGDLDTVTNEFRTYQEVNRR